MVARAPRPFGYGRPMADVFKVMGPVLPTGEAHELFVVDGRVTYEPVAGAEVAATGYVVPGLVDAHCHVGLDAHGEVPPETAEQQALTDREAGALLLRDCGQPGDTRWIDDRADLPRLVRAGRHLARPKRYIRNYAHEIDDADLPAYVAQEAQRGDGWVKIVGDWIDRDRGDLAPCWSDDTLAAAVEVAHAHGARMTAHVFGSDALPGLIGAGIDCLEHGTGLTEDLIDDMAARGTALVPTLINIDNFPGYADAGEAKFPAYASTMRDLHARRYATIAAAHEAGVPVFTGTDAGGVMAHGLVADEVMELAKAGMTPEQALSAGSWGARAWLGFDALSEGASADFCVYASNPLDDLSTLKRPVRVVLRGRVVA